MNAFETAWALMKMAWKPDQIEHDGLFGDEQGPLPEPVDAGLYKPAFAVRRPDWYHEHTYNKEGTKKNQWHMSHDQDWALNPFIQEYIPPQEQRKKPIGERSAWEDRGGRWIQVDRMLKPLLEELWRRGIKTKFSDQGGDTRENPLYQYNDILEEKSVFGGNERPTDTQEGYLWFGPEGIPEDAKDMIRFEDYWKKHNEWPKDAPWVDNRKFDHEDNPDGETIRWAASDDMSNLRQIYDAFGVAFPDEYMKDGGYQWR